MFTEYTDADGNTRWADPASVPADARSKPFRGVSRKKRSAVVQQDAADPLREEVPADGVDGPPDDL